MFRYTIPLFFICFLSCKTETERMHEKALPHSIEARENTAPTRLSEDDKKLLAAAKGRTVSSLNYSQLANRLEFASEKLHIFNFWRLKCDACDENNRHLEQLQTIVGATRVKIIHVNMDEKYAQDEVNAYIREVGMVGDIYQLEKNQGVVNKLGIEWDTELPAMYLVNNTEEVKLYYQQSFTFEELEAVVQPLVL